MEFSCDESGTEGGSHINSLAILLCHDPTVKGLDAVLLIDKVSRPVWSHGERGEIQCKLRRRGDFTVSIKGG